VSPGLRIAGAPLCGDENCPNAREPGTLYCRTHNAERHARHVIEKRIPVIANAPTQTSGQEVKHFEVVEPFIEPLERARGTLTITGVNRNAGVVTVAEEDGADWRLP